MLLALLLKEWKYVAIAALLAFSGCTYDEMRDTKADLKAEKEAHEATVSNFKTAQKLAEEKLRQELERIRIEGQEKANAADNRYTDLLATYRSNLLRYQTNRGVSGQSCGSPPPYPTESSDGPSSSSELPSGTVTITVEDAQICAENTARLKTAREWALDER